MYLNKGLENECFTGKFTKFLLKLFFSEMLMDGCSKNSNKIFSKTLMDASACITKNHRKMSNCSKVMLVSNN